MQQLLVAASAEKIADPAERAHVDQMSETMRGLLQEKSLGSRSRLAPLAAVLALLALLCSGAQAYYARTARVAETESNAETQDFIRATSRDMWGGDPRVQLTIDEMARRAPSLSTGTLQAWWAGEEARRVQSLEALAKRQMLEGDRAGAVRSAKRADTVRSGIETLASFEKPPQN